MEGLLGEDPPYQAPVFVLAHHEREPVPRNGGTTFNFVTDGIASALDRARAAAGSGNVAIAGGATTINQYLVAGPPRRLALLVPREPSEPMIGLLTDLGIAVVWQTRDGFTPIDGPACQPHTPE